MFLYSILNKDKIINMGLPLYQMIVDKIILKKLSYKRIKVVDQGNKVSFFTHSFGNQFRNASSKWS